MIGLLSTHNGLIKDQSAKDPKKVFKCLGGIPLPFSSQWGGMANPFGEQWVKIPFSLGTILTTKGLPEGINILMSVISGSITLHTTLHSQ